MAKLIVDLSEELKGVIAKYAKKNGITIKQATFRAYGLLIKEFKEKTEKD